MAEGQLVIPKPLEMWLVDRSRDENNREHCARARYLGYHAGPTGYGYRRKAQSVPAMTGTSIHDPVKDILLHARAKGGFLPGDDVIYTAIRVALQKYDQIVEKRGLRLIIDETDLLLRTAEQKLLIEGLVWAWCRTVLPRLLQEWEIVAVEEEGLSVLGCTCGLGDRIGTPEQHDLRQCNGLVWMTRPDFLLRRRAYPQTYRYDDLKSTSDAGMNWELQWQYRTQLLAGVLGAEQKYEVKIDEVYIHGLVKGRREGEYNYETKKRDGQKYQNSRLVYGYCRPAIPPALPEDWQFSYAYTDSDGKSRKLSRDYQRTIILAMQGNLWAGCYSIPDFWTRAMGPELLSQHVKIVGPLYPRGDGQDWKLKSFITQIVAVENRVRRGYWRLYDLMQQGHAFSSPEFQAVLDEEFPQTRGSHCRSFFGDLCDFVDICDRRPGWEDPSLLGLIPRRPHHAAELEQAIGRGLLPTDDGLTDPDEE